MAENTIETLEKRVFELENEVDKLKHEIKETLNLIANHFSTELDRVMEEYKKEIEKIALKVVDSHKQHVAKFMPK
ncbi:hypothetical protein [Paenibacillus apii]|uniref:hypothetical protein n=1 Tax=Paenibacillus apii TaxID=1850370 RepID=UPI00143A27D7|nr:hypothetical protein [Paenibacillus apii]NJJ37843.1 hypothetical protein [Paenibacillus apii]